MEIRDLVAGERIAWETGMIHAKKGAGQGQIHLIQAVVQGEGEEEEAEEEGIIMVGEDLLIRASQVAGIKKVKVMLRNLQVGAVIQQVVGEILFPMMAVRKRMKNQHGI